MYKTPGVYVEEISTFPPSVAEVATAIPAFIGYTQSGGAGTVKVAQIQCGLWIPVLEVFADRGDLRKVAAIVEFERRCLAMRVALEMCVLAIFAGPHVNLLMPFSAMKTRTTCGLGPIEL